MFTVTGPCGKSQFHPSGSKKVMSRKSITTTTKAAAVSARHNQAVKDCRRFGVRTVNHQLIILAFAAFFSTSLTPAAAQGDRVRRIIAEAENIRVAVAGWHAPSRRTRPRVTTPAAAAATSQTRRRITAPPSSEGSEATKARDHDPSGQTRPRRATGRKNERRRADICHL